MSDRDPALEAALHTAIRDDARIDGVCVEHFKDGWHAALRSLGAGTPEAQAALRELVQATLRMHGEGREHIENVCHCAAHLARAGGEFAALATPTEEGR